MTLRNKTILWCALCAAIAGPITVAASDPAPHHPAKAAAPAKPATATTVIPTPGVSVVPKKPLVVTAVTPHGPITHYGQLNPQPIPPGVGGPADPVR